MIVAATISPRVHRLATSAPIGTSRSAGDQKNSPFWVLKRTAATCGDANDIRLLSSAYEFRSHDPLIALYIAACGARQTAAAAATIVRRSRRFHNSSRRSPNCARLATPNSGSSRRNTAFTARVSTIAAATTPSASDRGKVGRDHQRSTSSSHAQIRKKEKAWLNVASYVP